MPLARTLIFMAALANTGSSLAGDVAIVVNKANKVEAISAKDLKQIFAGEKTRWPDGTGILTLAVSSAVPEHKNAVQFLFGMNEAEYQRYCIHANFVGEAQKIPRDTGNSSAVVSLVAVIPGAIGFVDAGAATPAVRILKVNGLAPGETGYPISVK